MFLSLSLLSSLSLSLPLSHPYKIHWFPKAPGNVHPKYIFMAASPPHNNTTPLNLQSYLPLSPNFFGSLTTFLTHYLSLASKLFFSSSFTLLYYPNSITSIMASNTELPGRRNSSTQLLEELEALSQTLYQSHISATRRTASLALPRSSAPPIPSADEADNEDKLTVKPRSRRMSLSPWRPRPNQPEKEKASSEKGTNKKLLDSDSHSNSDSDSSSKKKGIWSWKPMRALSHIGMQKLSCLFSVEVVTAQGLPASMNGLRLSVCVRKKETKDGAVNTMPSRVSQGAADFEETLFIRCHVYCAPQKSNGGAQQRLKFEPRPFLVYVFAVDASELDFGRSSVDLSRLIQESLEKSAEGARVRQWDTSFDLAGKARGGQLLLKLGFQIMEKDGGIGLFNQLEDLKSGKDKSSISSRFGRKQSKSSFSIPSPKITSRAVLNPADIDDLNLDEPEPEPEPQKSKEADTVAEEELDLPEFEVVDKGVEEIQSGEKGKEEELTVVKAEDSRSELSEVVKEVVEHDQFYLTRLTELDSIAQQIKALESMMSQEKLNQSSEDGESQRLDAEEENVTMEFLQMLEDEEASEYRQFQLEKKPTALRQLEQTEESANDDESSKVFLSDLGKGLGCVVQTRNGGFLAATNPLNVAMSRKDMPKLAMQISRPFVLTLDKSISGFELFQMMAAVGVEQLSSELLSLMPIEELMGKTAEQVAFEGIASAIISGRNKEGATSSAARILAAVKKMASAMSSGRKERISTGIWNVGEDPLTVEEILAFSLQKIETMSVEALKIQADMAEEDAPFDVSALSGRSLTTGDGKDQNDPLSSAVPLEEWLQKNDDDDDSAAIAVAVVVQLRDPLRRYETVGGPVIALVHATPVEKNQEKYEEDMKFRVTSVHVGGMKTQTGQKRNAWDSEKQRLTAMQWLIAHNMGKAARKGKAKASNKQDVLWSISSRIVADMWLKAIRNPDVKFTK